MTEYPDHVAIARKLLDQQGEITRLEGQLQTATRERDEALADLEKWDDLRAETHEQMRAGLTELIQSKWDAELCDPDAATAADTVLDYLENDFASQLARMQQRAEKAEALRTPATGGEQR